MPRVDFDRLSPAEYEDMVSVLLSRLRQARRVDGSGGDGGRDCYFQVEEGTDAYELKSFTGRMEPTQRRQVKRSLARAMENKPRTWTLVVPIDPTPGEQEWFDSLGADLGARLEWLGKKFGLELHPDKTRLIEFGRFAAASRAGRGLGKPETSGFLGFTHICGKSKSGRFWIRRITIAKRMRAKLKMVKDQLRRRMHQPIPVQGRWLASVVRGHMAYYGVPGNAKAVAAFRDQATRHWRQTLRRRSQKTRIDWTRMHRISTRWLPPARVMHPFPEARFTATHPR